MKFHRQDWRKRVFRGELFQQTLQRVARIQSLIDPTQPLAQLALRFCLSHPAVTTVIPGVRSAEQVEHNLMAREGGSLPQEMLDKLTQVWQQEMYDGVRTSIGEEVEG